MVYKKKQHLIFSAALLKKLLLYFKRTHSVQNLLQIYVIYPNERIHTLNTGPPYSHGIPSALYHFPMPMIYQSVTPAVRQLLFYALTTYPFFLITSSTMLHEIL